MTLFFFFFLLNRFAFSPLLVYLLLGFSHLITNSFPSKDSTTRAERERELYAFESKWFRQIGRFWMEQKYERKKIGRCKHAVLSPRADSIMEISFIVYFPFSELYMESGMDTMNQNQNPNHQRICELCDCALCLYEQLRAKVSKSMLFMYFKATMTWNAMFKCYKFHNFARINCSFRIVCAGGISRHALAIIIFVNSLNMLLSFWNEAKQHMIKWKMQIAFVQRHTKLQSRLACFVDLHHLWNVMKWNMHLVDGMLMGCHRNNA